MSRMLPLREFHRPPWPALLTLSVVGHAFALALPGATTLPELCGSWSNFVIRDPVEAAHFLLESAGPWNLALGWLTMLLVMMPPILGWAVAYIWRSTFPHRRIRTVLPFLLSYATLWLIAGLPLLGAALALQAWVGPGTQAVTLALAAALLWSCSPWQRTALNRGHRLMRIGVCGWKADRDALLFGRNHGAWCVLSCWPWMLVPMVAGKWHVPVMAVATFAMFIERLVPPSIPRWRRPAMTRLLESWFDIASIRSTRRG